MSAAKKSRFLRRRGKVSKARERWIFIECEIFGLPTSIWLRSEIVR